MPSPDRRSRGVGLALVALALGSVGLVAALAVARSPQEGRAGAARSAAGATAGAGSAVEVPAAPAQRRSGPGATAVARYRQDAAFEALAIGQARRWASTADRPESVAAGLSPATCDGEQPDAAVFLLPSAVGRPSEEPTVASTDCVVGAGSRVLADLGGLIATEDANGLDGGYDLADGTRVAFAPEHLPAICADVLEQGLQPPPREVSLDGAPQRDVRAVVSAVFPLAIVEGSPLASDAAALGHPDHVSAAYCGYKLLLDPLPAGDHVLRAVVQGNRTITWRLHVGA